MDGICTLANDRVYDQLVALLNSIEVNGGKDIPVCVYPYDDNTERIKAEIAQRPKVQLFDNQEIIERWDNFAKSAWEPHPTAKERWLKAGSRGYHRFGTHRRYCAFDGPFDRFIYMDGDTLLMSPLDRVFAQLDNYDCVVYDFQHKDITHVYEVTSPKLLEIFPQERLNQEIFCSGFYGSKKGLFDGERRNWLLEQLRAGEAEILYPMAPDQTIVNYMMMRSNFSIYNLALQLPKEERTGCCVTSPHFQALDNNILYDRGKRLTYLHYIGLSSSLFTRLCSGENLDFPYRDIFLHYRYLHQPSQRPIFTGSPKPYQPPTPTFWQKVTRKLGLGK
ncbi:MULTISPECIES: Npun_R2821/Npun_R2822 family protein [unclassified Microcystis]|uniref:Npun_R2821/Npun_R2822 family protein n=1 Tax=unclassified Microcystis TaxID=2643300 RepID=UPI00118EDF32|nr:MULTISPECIES: Npun_R2821/Npun_R2822 family protein [unclassified Microcystis]MCA2924748.1 sugar transferase [Microcystis sp. M020S1]MCA2934612.1 sugar transferase [Microcystis sp. M015S1]MCA2619537.1 sugar transferase [Microcystis sp. M099S2]MCA2651873.1 sugar transferase [Microcystis sp. M065S2]MCA2680584.1 sugar transferase [Microcystis sp. M043S2]